MELDTVKVLIIFGLLILTLLAGLLPLQCLKLTARYKKRKRRKQGCDGENCHDKYGNGPDCEESTLVTHNGNVATPGRRRKPKKSKKVLIMSVLNCFAGGIFLGTSFIGLLPEIRQCFSQFDIRWPDLTPSPKNFNGSNSTSTEKSEQQLMPIAEMIVVGGLFFILCVEQVAHGWSHNRAKRKGHPHGSDVVGVRMSNLNGQATEDGAPHEHQSADISLNLDNDNVPDHDHSALRSLILVSTLSVHSLLEGVAIGLQKEAQSAITLFVAVLLHKSLMAFSMGTNLIQSKQTVRKIVAAALTFALASPIGIAIGLIVKTFGGDDSGTQFVNAILQAIATGTFLYITFFEVLVKEFENHGNRLAKVLSLFAGYGSVLTTFFANNG